jgi:hypothetical protein
VGVTIRRPLTLDTSAAAQAAIAAAPPGAPVHIEPGCQPEAVYRTSLAPWREALRVAIVNSLTLESEAIARLQKWVRTPARDKYFFWSAVLGSEFRRCQSGRGPRFGQGVGGRVSSVVCGLRLRSQSLELAWSTWARSRSQMCPPRNFPSERARARISDTSTLWTRFSCPCTPERSVAQHILTCPSTHVLYRIPSPPLLDGLAGSRARVSTKRVGDSGRVGGEERRRWTRSKMSGAVLMT